MGEPQTVEGPFLYVPMPIAVLKALLEKRSPRSTACVLSHRFQNRQTSTCSARFLAEIEFFLSEGRQVGSDLRYRTSSNDKLR